MHQISQVDRIIAARELRESLLADRSRPGYHFVIPEDVGHPGDPNGAFYANGRYHLMYLYSRRGLAGMDNKGFSWGHVSSHDLLHWRHHPDAIFPSDGDGGCFSGGAFVDDDGTAYLSFWRLPLQGRKAGAEGEGIGVARSTDANYDYWEKLDIPSLDASEWGIRELKDPDNNSLPVGNADPSNIWKKDGVYYMQAGNLLVLNKLGRKPDSRQRYRGDWVELLRSKDLINWEFVHRFYQRDVNNLWTEESEDDMCPSFLPLPSSRNGGELSGKYLQLFISHNRGCQYYVGNYDTDRDLFVPEKHGRMSWVDNTFFAPEAVMDAKNRQIMWAWLTDNPHKELDDMIHDGWSGVYGLPRVLWVEEDNCLRMAPIPELEALRINQRFFSQIHLTNGNEEYLSVANSLSAEISVVIRNVDCQAAGLKVRAGENGDEQTLVYYDYSKRVLVFDASHSGPRGRTVIEEAPLELKDDEELRLQVFIDKSVVDIFANERQAITRRIYPNRKDSDGISLFCRGGSVEFDSIKTWEMSPSNSW